ncbi:uncharacterized protein LOC110245364 [Exaiptasia diaphana]|uniref:Chromo domain-containing protein n=1 Tax=Exaiptasia diaphana TaxID=2652724 RepID=A0A913YMQ0_EXADI|nr:uncharacterized protein LOC110245364 [Exaiptasia diaphana]
MASKRACRRDYKQLNAFSSVVLYDTSSKTYGKYFEVERIIERRRKSNDYEYLLKWNGWPYDCCSWEPSINLNPVLLRFAENQLYLHIYTYYKKMCKLSYKLYLLYRSYSNPQKPADERMMVASRDFYCAVVSFLRGKSLAPIYVNLELDVWSFLTYNKGKESQHQGHKLYEKEDFILFKTLPTNWYFTLNEHGEGVAIDFPIKAKPVLLWSASHYCIKSKKLEKAPKFPIDKICLTICKKACNLDNLIIV